MKKNKIVILFPCVGRRVGLLSAFYKACARLDHQAVLIGTDTTETSPALQCCDRQYLVKPVNHKSYANQVLDIVRRERVDLLIPTVDLDLAIWARLKGQLEKMGCTAMISSPGVVDICQDKRLTYKFLKQNDFDTPDTMTPAAALREKRFPYFLKPWDGHASRGNAIVRDREELRFYASRIPNCLVQRCVNGVELTIDIFVDFDLRVRCLVARRRLETRAGEVSKSITVKNLAVLEQARRLIESLKAGPGVITIQCFVTPENHIKFIEINPRFGGGAPLSIQAGADFPRWILQLCLGQKPRIPMYDWQNNLLMLRYDKEIWIQK
jgi:carbamoyl-phosphate synthase large subunit